MVLNRNPDNFFAETEQVAFHTANVVPGIDFTNDPLLQFRNFSYLDTQLIRLGGPNFAQLPVNRPVAEVRTNQQDGYGQHAIPQGRSSYFKNTIGGGCPALADENVFRHYTQRVDGQRCEARQVFENHYSQARMFWKSMSAVEAEHIVAAFAFELGKVEVPDIRSAVVAQLVGSTMGWRAQVAAKLGFPSRPRSRSTTRWPRRRRCPRSVSATRIESRKIAVLAADGVDVVGTQRFKELMDQRGAVVEVLAPVAGGKLRADRAASCRWTGRSRRWLRCSTTRSWWRADRDRCRRCGNDGYAVHFVTEAYKHLKPIGAFGAGIDLLRDAQSINRLAEDAEVVSDQSVVTTTAAADNLPDEFVDEFAAALADTGAGSGARTRYPPKTWVCRAAGAGHPGAASHPATGGDVPSSSIKNEKMYQDLRKKGDSKEKAARISNAAASRGKSSVGRKGGKSGSMRTGRFRNSRSGPKSLACRLFMAD